MMPQMPAPNPMQVPQGQAPMGQGQAPQDPSQQPGQDPTQGMPQPPQQQGEPQQPDLPEMPQRDPIQNYIDAALSDTNLAEHFKNKKSPNGGMLLDEIGAEIKRGVEEDERSRESWMKTNKEWMKLAMLVRENKSFPWPNASNVKYPLVATAAMQFSARAYPALVPSDGNIVKTKLIAQNPQDIQWQAASRISTHMSFQVMNRIPNWEEDMDKLLMTMAITGICFKKTYHSSIEGVHHSHIVYPENLIINYWAKSIEKAYRKTEVLHYNRNEVQEKINCGDFLKVDLPDPTTVDEEKDKHASGSESPSPDRSTPLTFWSCHTYWDLDDDGYEEPYVITIHKDSGKVVRIIARWDSDGVKRNDKDKKKIDRIAPVEYFTDFPFIPNPDGSIYAMGFGMLLGPLNESANTIINQLVDAGTLANMQSGFIGKGLRLKIGQTQLRPGEWQVVNATGDDLNKSIFPLPVKEPSNVLMTLLNMLIQSGNQLASIAEIFVGKMPGQNTPATTTQETIQQGMAVFTAIYKRVYRSLAKEFRKLYRLNRITPSAVQEEQKIGGIPMQSSDYDLPDWVIIPGADPTGDSMSTKLAKLQSVGSLIQMGTISPQVYTQMFVDANQIPNGQSLIVQPQPPQPDPKMQTEQAKQDTEKLKQQGIAAKQQGDAAAKQQELAIKERMAAVEEMQRQQEMRHKETLAAMEAQGARMDMHMNLLSKVLEQRHNEQKNMAEMVQGGQKFALDQQRASEAHQANMSQKDQAFKQNQQQRKANMKGRKPNKGA